MLKEYKLSMTGRKEQLLEKLVQLAVTQYELQEAAPNTYFSSNRYIKVKADTAALKKNFFDEEPIQEKKHKGFAVLPDHPLHNLILSMYITRHLRGSVILDAGYCNDTCTLNDVARALIQEDIILDCAFLRVE